MSASRLGVGLVVAVVAVGCGEGSVARPGSGGAEHPAPAPAPVSDEPAAAAHPGRPGEAASPCAFESVDALCASLREQYTSTSGAWVSEGCGRGARHTSEGPFAEAMVVAVHVGSEPPADPTPVERQLLGSRVREPTGGGTPSTYYVLAARIGERWFPLTLQPGPIGDPGARAPFEWSIEPSGDFVTWTVERGSGDRASGGYGERERTVAGVDQGTPKIAAQATVESWRTDVDLTCTRACNAEPSPPPQPGCSRRCASTTVTTRSWERHGATVAIGATRTRVEGRPAPSGTEPSGPTGDAETKRLDAPEQWLDVCGFMPVVHAVAPAALPDDPESVAARARAQEALRHGRWADVAGARAAAGGARRNAILEIYGNVGGACGGGGCTAGIQYRTIEGSMPEQGVAYFYADDNRGAGCDPRTLPEAGHSTFVEVAPVTPEQTVACGLSGFDGTTRRTWVVLRVFVPRPER